MGALVLIRILNRKNFFRILICNTFNALISF